jgi:hypothetical protein
MTPRTQEIFAALRDDSTLIRPSEESDLPHDQDERPVPPREHGRDPDGASDTRSEDIPERRV